MEILTNRNSGTSFLLDDKYRIYRHLALQIAILAITIGIFFDTPDKLNLSLNRFYGWVCYLLLMNMLVYFNAYVLFPRFLVKNNLYVYIVSVSVFILVTLFLLILIQELFYDIAVTQQETSAMAIFLNIASSLLALLLFLGGISALLFLKHWMISSRRIHDLQLATAQSELNFLKSQINPHFLFNMLNNANIMVDEDANMASHILVKLDDLLRYQMNDSTKEKVYLSADIIFLTDFLDLEKIRRDDFKYTISKDGDVNDIKIPPLLFIPFVENAVKHNSDSENQSYVTISFNVLENKLIFICENSKPKRSQEREDGGLGLANIKRRLDLLYGENYLLEQQETEATYTVHLILNI